VSLTDIRKEKAEQERLARRRVELEVDLPTRLGIGIMLSGSRVWA